MFEFFGYLAGICTAVCFLPQTMKTIRFHDVKSLSLISYLLYALGLMSWIIYGVYKASIQMIIFNAIGVFFALIIIWQIVKYNYCKREK